MRTESYLAPTPFGGWSRTPFAPRRLFDPQAESSALKAAEMAGQAIDRLGDQTATVEERAQRKHRLIKGPREFRDVQDDQRKKKG